MTTFLVGSHQGGPILAPCGARTPPGSAVAPRLPSRLRVAVWAASRCSRMMCRAWAGCGALGVVPGRRCARWCRLPMLRLGVGLTGSGASDPGRSTPLFCGGDVTLRGSCRRRASSRPFALMHGSRRCRCVGCVAGVCRGCLVRVGGAGVSGLAPCARVLRVHLLG